MKLSTTRLRALNRLSDQIRRDDQTLITCFLKPDGKYQTHATRLGLLEREVSAWLSEAFARRAPEEFPMLFYGWGRCRVGSTAFANMFGAAGLPSYFQPVKSAMRNLLTESPPPPWTLPSRQSQPYIFSKEVAGPYLLAECLYIPLKMLIEAGYPPDRLHLIMLDRQPTLSLASWFAKWSDRVSRNRLLEHFILASLNAIRVEAYARRQGVATTHYVHEASRQPERAAAALFRRLLLSSHFSTASLTNWRDVDDFDSDRSYLIFTREPDVYFVQGVHQAGSTYRYLDRDRGSVTDDDLELLDRMGVPSLYHASVQACERELGLSLDLSEGTNAPPLRSNTRPDGLAVSKHSHV